MKKRIYLLFIVICLATTASWAKKIVYTKQHLERAAYLTMMHTDDKSVQQWVFRDMTGARDAVCRGEPFNITSGTHAINDEVDGRVPLGDDVHLRVDNEYMSTHGGGSNWIYYKVNDGMTDPRVWKRSTYNRSVEEFLEMLNSGKIVILEGGPDESEPQLSKEDAGKLGSILQGLLNWLLGRSDPFGWGQRTGPLASIALEMVGTIMAILLGSGYSVALSGIAAPPVPATPSTQGPPDINLRRKDDEDETDVPPVPEEQQKGFSPTHYPDLCKKYIRENPDGTLTMRDPISGKPLTYYPTADNKWESETGTTYNNEELEENLRFRYDNSDTLRKDAEQAARNKAEQRSQWDSQNNRDRDRGYSDTSKQYKDWKEKHEADFQKQERVDRLANEYGVPPTEESVRRAIQQQQVIDGIEHDMQMERDKALAESEAFVNKIDKGAELTVNIMGECVPGGRAVKNIYTFSKSVGVGYSKGLMSGEGKTAVFKAMGYGALDGALGVMQNQAGDITKNFGVEATMVIGGESMRKGLEAIADGKSPAEVNDAMYKGAKSKAMFFLVGKGIQAAGNSVKDALGSTGKVDINYTPSAGESIIDKAAKTFTDDMNALDKVIGKTDMTRTWNAVTGDSVDVVEGLASGAQESLATFGVNDLVTNPQDFNKTMNEIIKNLAKRK